MPSVKVNPLARWDSSDLRDYITAHNLPRHPLVAKGFPSVGCGPCTTRVGSGENARAGRWRNTPKSECGIHFDNGQIARSA
jgi:phosphoadenosine phosphosulfate reductase